MSAKPYAMILAAALMAAAWPQNASAQELTPEAKQIFANYHKAVIQVRVISLSSGEKSSLGSGFYFTPDGLIATNYHVIADAANFPDLYDVEFLTPEGSRGTLEIINVDPIHDLAVLTQTTVAPPAHLTLGSSEQLQKGTKIFSFGNPFDMGLIIVEGLFNGTLERAKYKKILFSGSLNPGMSGGPAVLSDGSIFGINVSTAGDDISFFVPVEHLKDLYKEIQENGGKSAGPDWHELIRKRLTNAQEAFVRNLVEEASGWKTSVIGNVKVPGEISNEFKCWARSGSDPKVWIKDEYLTCSTEDYIYISSGFYTGLIYINYEWYLSRSDHPFRFYNLYERYAANREFPFNNALERNVANFACDQKFVDLRGRRLKMEVCARAYVDFEGLMDIGFQLTTTDRFSEGLVINGKLLGFTPTQGMDFLRKFLSEIEWQKSP